MSEAETIQGLKEKLERMRSKATVVNKEQKEIMTVLKAEKAVIARENEEFKAQLEEMRTASEGQWQASGGQGCASGKQAQEEVEREQQSHLEELVLKQQQHLEDLELKQQQRVLKMQEDAQIVLDDRDHKARHVTILAKQLADVEKVQSSTQEKLKIMEERDLRLSAELVSMTAAFQKELETLNHTDVQSNPGDTVEEQLRFELKGKDEALMQLLNDISDAKLALLQSHRKEEEANERVGELMKAHGEVVQELEKTKAESAAHKPSGDDSELGTMVEQMGKDLAKRKQELAAADELHAADTVQMAKYEGEIHQLASQLSALEIKQEQEVEMLKTKHEDQATSMRSKHEAEVASIKELQAEQLKMLQTNQQSQSTRMNEMQEAEIQQIQNQLSAEMLDLKQALHLSEVEKNHMREDLKSLTEVAKQHDKLAELQLEVLRSSSNAQFSMVGNVPAAEQGHECNSFKGCMRMSIQKSQ